MIEPYYQDSLVTIYHGDCREIAPQVRADAIISDPPYGMSYDTDGSRFTLGGRSLPAVRGDTQPFDSAPWVGGYSWVVLWGFNHFPTGLPNGGCLIWLKRTPAAFGKFLSDAEVAWNKKGCGVYAFLDHKHAIACDREHPTQKPVGLMRWSIERSGAPEGSVVLDPYMGSGTTLMAAKDLGRRAIGIEIEERYCEIAAERCRQEVLDLGGAA